MSDWDEIARSNMNLAVQALLQIFNIQGENLVTHRSILTLEHTEGPGAPRKIYKCPICGPEYTFRLTELRFHLDKHLRIRTYECDICLELLLDHVLNDVYPNYEYAGRGKKKRIIPWKMTFELLYKHYQNFHTREETPLISTLGKKICNGGTRVNLDRYNSLKTGKQLPFIHNGIEITYDLIQELAGTEAKKEPYEWDKVIGCNPADATHPDQVVAYEVRWTTLKKGRKETTWERVKKYRGHGGEFISTGGAWGIWAFWKWRDPTVEFNHVSMHYLDTAWFRQQVIFARDELRRRN